MVSPDRGSITLTVEFQSPDLSKATRDASNSYNRLTNEIKKLKLADLNLRTAEYSVFEVKEWEKNQHVSKGFRARMGLWVSTSDINKIGEVIAIASKEKVKNVDSLQTYLSDEKQLEEETKCLSEAAKNAKMKAEKLASASNAKLGEVLSISEASRAVPYYPAPRLQKFQTRAMAMESDMEAPSIEVGQQTLSLTIQATFALK